MPTIIQELLKWREKNHLSQRAAVEVMKARSMPMSLYTLQDWEQGRRSPSAYSARLLQLFLDQNPHIVDPPTYRRGPK